MLVPEIVQQFNDKYKPVFTTRARYIHIWGGRGRGGSYFGTDYFLHLITRPEYFRGYIMRQVAGDIRESLWRDFNDRIVENETIDQKLFALQDFSMTAQYLPTGNEIISKGFKKSSGNQTAKLKSIAGATHVLIEEGEETSEEDFNQLDDSLRTIKGEIQIIFIFNPPHKDHWIMKRWYNLEPIDDKEFEGYYKATPKNDPSLLSIHSTYLDNLVNINQTTIENFERYRLTNFEYYATMIRGLVSEGMKGIIFKKWKPMSNHEFNELPYPSFYGLDFGFSSDPAALVEIKAHNEKVWLRELLYETGYTNPMLSERFKQLGLNKSSEIFADSAEPKSIKELKDMGWNVKESQKGADSIRAGIQFLLSKNVFYTDNSKNLIKEKEAYRWALDADKNPTDKPVDESNHLMDATRYGIYTKLNGFKFKVVVG
jgi:phage terminase large subunit